MEKPMIYEAINKVMADVGSVGKNSKNTQQGFMYRGIDAVMNALNPAMIKNGIFVMPTVIEEHREERTTTKGGVMFSVRLLMDYNFIALDGSSVTARVIGEAMDSGDKATNKAMSVAFKYACFQTFCIPTEELRDEDPDGHTPEETVPQKVLVDEPKIKTLRKELERTGAKEEAVLARYKLESIEQMDIPTFMRAMKGLEKTPDKPKAEPVQEDLGFN